VEPRAGTNEHTVYKIIGTVVAVRSTRVRIISVIAVRACGCRTDIPRTGINRTNTNTDTESNLGVGGAGPRHDREKTDQNCIL
jgi:hypothetical protein